MSQFSVMDKDKNDDKKPKSNRSSDNEDGGRPISRVNDRLSPGENMMPAASPPRFVNFEELMQAADSVSKMTLAHEISLDNEFRLDQKDPPPNSLERQVKDTVIRVFWDNLRQQLNSDPPNYTLALSLLGEIKEMLMGLILSNSVRMRTRIDENLDLDLIDQQLKNGTLDLKGYANFVIETMAMLCAPARDEIIADIKKIDDPVDLYKEIFRILELMHMDMANFTIKQMRPYIQQQSVAYEQKKFHEFLETQRNLGIDGLGRTRHWLEDTFNYLVDNQKAQQALKSNSEPDASVDVDLITPNSILTTAYLHLLKWDPREHLPETTMMDEKRILLMGETLRNVTMICSMILVTCNMGGQKAISSNDLKNKLKEHAMIILDGINIHNMNERVESLAEQFTKDLTEFFNAQKITDIDSKKKDIMKTQIKECQKRLDNPVYKVLYTRLFEFLHSSLFSAQTAPLQFPAGMSVVDKELSEICGLLLRIFAHNRSVFGQYYAEIIQRLIKPEVITPRDIAGSSSASPRK